MKPGLNTRDKYRGRELTLQISSNHNFDLGKINKTQNMINKTQKKYVHDKTKFAKRPQDVYLG